MSPNSLQSNSILTRPLSLSFTHTLSSTSIRTHTHTRIYTYTHTHTHTLTLPPTHHTHTHTHRVKQEEEEMCPICLDSLTMRQSKMLPCGHAIHTQCLKTLGKPCTPRIPCIARLPSTPPYPVHPVCCLCISFLSNMCCDISHVFYHLNLMSFILYFFFFSCSSGKNEF